MKLSITITVAGLLSLASSTSACMQAYIGYDFVSSTIQTTAASSATSGTYLSPPEETSYPLDCLEIDGLPWAAHIIKPNMENFRPAQPAQRWAIRVWHGDFNEQYVLDNPNWDGKDNMLHMNGAVWSCDRWEQYLQEEQKNEEMWGSVGK